jgi:putative ABC transport system permease protein
MPFWRLLSGMNSISALDVRLGIRMLRKYPGLSAISVLSMAVAIAVGAAGFGMFDSFFNTRLPIEDSDRLIAIRWARNGGRQQSAADFHMWRAGVSSVPDLAAFSDTRRTLLVPGQTPEPIEIAAMTAAGFRATRVPALMGRVVLDSDEVPDAPPVLVVAYDEWQDRFGGDPAIIGREVRLGNVINTVVGVMPQGFHFPVNHRFWTTLRVLKTADPATDSPVFVFGRLTDSATLAQAQSEVSVIAAQAAAADPGTDTRHYRARLHTYGAITLDLGDGAFVLKTFWQTFVSLLLVVVAVNVAVLVYARTASRAGEIAVRTALGASRGRIVGQLFIEALVLSAVAAVLGLSLAAYGLGEIARLVLGGMPYWISFGLSTSMVVYTCGLVVFAAALVGVIPALKGTGRRMHAGLQQFSSRGWDLTLGRTWTAMIVVQVAVAVAVLPFAVDLTVTTVSSGLTKVHYPIDQFLEVSISPESATVSPAVAAGGKDARFQRRVDELLRRLEAEPGVAGVAFARSFGGRFSDRIEVEEPKDDSLRGVQWTGSNRVDVNFMPVLGVRMLAGRGFTSADAADDATSVIVDRGFAVHFFGNRDALGLRLRVMREANGRETPGPWLQVVGVVEDFVTGETDFERPTMYRAVPLEHFSNAVSLAVRTRPSPATLTARVRELAAAVDPSLQLNAVQPAIDAERERQRSMFLLGLMTVAVTMSVLLLSAGGIYAMMSFTVVRRRREIGIRSALGADPRRLLFGVFGRASAQLGAGVAVGVLVALALAPAMGVESTVRERGIIVFPIVALVIVAVGLLAAIGPARRGLSIQPTEALREE